jgi:argininosuccinate synthase
MMMRLTSAYPSSLSRQAHIDLETLVMDGKVRELRDQFCTFTWSRLIYNGMVSLLHSVGRQTLLLTYLAL